MERFLIELEHEEKTIECAKVVEVFLKTGSHFLSNTEWGCKDGDHRSWLIVDVENKEEARQILPPAFRSQARIVKLYKFNLEEVQEILSQHKD
jgi:hypothetical protein